MPSARGRTLLASAVAAGLVVTGIGWAAAAAPGGTTTTQQTRDVIVVLRNQHTDLANGRGATSPRVLARVRDQAPLIANAKKLGAHNVRGFQLINGFAAAMTPAQVSALATDPNVAGIFPDLPIARSVVAPGAASTSLAGPPHAAPAICPSNPAQPLLEPEALQTTHAAYADPSTPQAQNVVTGEGVKVAWIADGIDVNNPDFIRPDGSHVIVDYQDFSGEGLNAPTDAEESFGDASSIAAQGLHSYDLADFANPAAGVPAGCTITVRGMAPGASLVGLKVFGNADEAPTSRFISAIDYAVNVAKVDVINESFGSNPFPDTSDDPVALADDAAVAAGVTVVSGTGDAGTNGTFSSPGTDPNVIGVAGTTNFRIYQQMDLAGAQFSNGTWTNDNIASLSGGGVSRSDRVPDLSAPGDSGWALCSPDPTIYQGCLNFTGQPSPIQDFGGTSQSAPLVSGAAALVIAAYEQTHHGVRPTPALVKQLLTSTATDLGYPGFEQGAGEVNALAAVRAAQSWRDGNGTPAATGTALAVGPTQLSAIGNPGSSVTQSLSIRNVSGATQTVHASTRALGTVTSKASGTIILNTATAPTFLEGAGTLRSYAKRTFAVPAGADRLDVSLASDTQVSPARVTLIDPHGAFTQFSSPQGDGNFGHVDVAHPIVGTWTAYFFLAQSSAFNGPIRYVVTTQRFRTAGTVSPSTFTLAPGASRTVHVTSVLGTRVGDVSASVQVTGGHGVTVSVPLSQRTMIPTTRGSNTFTGVITGGNGRPGGLAQSTVYYLDVPPGKKDLSLAVTLRKDPGVVIFGVLAGPDGQVASYQSNANADADGNLTVNNGFQLYRRDPTPGRWTFSLTVADPVTGLEVAQNFTAVTAFNTVKVSASLPRNANTKLSAGVPVTVPVKITNTGSVPLTYFADGRLDTVGAMPLPDLSGSPAVLPLPIPVGVVPFWQVPTETSRLVATATGSEPVNLDIEYTSGDPEVYATAVGNQAVVTVNAPSVSPGDWGADIGQSGPFDGPSTPGTVSVNAVAVGQLFDPAVTSSTGDVWLAGVDPSADPALAALVRANALRAVRPGGLAAFARTAHRSTPATATPSADATGPVILAPGQSTTITVTITPGAPAGSVVHGHLYIDTFGFFTGSGDELIDLPYAYTVG